MSAETTVKSVSQNAATASAAAPVLWAPTQEQIKRTRLYDFMQQTNKKYGLSLESYHDVWQWSVVQKRRFLE